MKREIEERKEMWRESTFDCNTVQDTVTVNVVRYLSGVRCFSPSPKKDSLLSLAVPVNIDCSSFSLDFS
ncbi:hypothetical protein YC2023_114696 [Brassica napus]